MLNIKLNQIGKSLGDVTKVTDNEWRSIQMGDGVVENGPGGKKHTNGRWCGGKWPRGKLLQQIDKLEIYNRNSNWKYANENE